MDLQTVLVITNILLAVAVGFLLAEVRMLWRELSLIPDPKTVLHDLIQSRLPIIMGPDGLPKIDINNPIPKPPKGDLPGYIG